MQQSLPHAKVLYSSATGASEPANLAYMVRDGFWLVFVWEKTCGRSWLFWGAYLGGVRCVGPLHNFAMRRPDKLTRVPLPLFDSSDKVRLGTWGYETMQDLTEMLSM